MKHIYNLSKDSPSQHDLKRSVNLKLQPKNIVPKIIDHRSTCPPIYQQGDVGSCTSSAICGVFYHNLVNFNYVNIFYPSRMFVYYNTRSLKHTINVDNGGSLRDALKALHIFGTCPEDLWQYNVNYLNVKPPRLAYRIGLKNSGITYSHVPQIISQLKQCLVDGFLFVFGISIYSSFESDVVEKTGYVPLPTRSDEYLGGHALCAVGYDDHKQVFIVRNSWGCNWGDNGYCYLPYEYMTNHELVYDIWTFINNAKENTISPPISPEEKKDKCILS